MELDGWRIDERGDVTIVRCDALSDVPGVRHAFSTRRAHGRGDFDLGSHDERTPEVAARRRLLIEVAGLGECAPTILQQVHGATVLDVEDVASADAPPRADGVIAFRETDASLAPAVRWADCVPVLLAEGRGRAVAAVHSGWRGTAAGIVHRAVERLGEFDIRPHRLRAALGPAVGPCCYAVGRDVASAVSRATGLPFEEPGPRARTPPTLDLRRAVRLQLERAGLAPDSIREAPWCTACSAELFFSHRRERGAAGRQMACVGWAAAA
jgi:YfiH family protein